MVVCSLDNYVEGGFSVVWGVTRCDSARWSRSAHRVRGVEFVRSIVSRDLVSDAGLRWRRVIAGVVRLRLIITVGVRR